LPFPSPGDLSDLGFEPRSPYCRQIQNRKRKENKQTKNTLFKVNPAGLPYQNSTRQTTVTRVNRIQKQHVIPPGPIEVAIIRLKMYNMQFKKIQNSLKHKELSRNYQNKQTENVFTS